MPLGPSSSDDEEGPCELPNGRLVCGPHGLLRCWKCCVNYVLNHDGEDDDDEGCEEDSDDRGLEA